MTEPKYKTLAELKAAIDSKEIVLGISTLTIDNDSTNLYEMIWNEEADDYETGELLFDGGCPQDLLSVALDLLGIPNEPA